MSDDNKPKISYSTDYMLDQIQNEDKMVSTSKRLPIIDENESDINDYLTDDNHNVANDCDNNSKHSKIDSDNKSILDGDKHSVKSDYEYENKNDETSKNKQIYNELFNDADDYDKLPKQQQLMKRLEVMTELGELVKYNGTKLTQPYNLESDYYTMKCELMIHKNIKSKEFFVTNLTGLTCYLSSGLESYNKRYNPFDLDLSGWSEGIESQSFEIADIWSQMYTKYGSPGKDMAPEMRLFYCLIIGPIMYDKSKKQAEEDKKKLREYQKNEDAMRQMKQVKQMNYASQQSTLSNVQQQLKEQQEIIRQQKEFILNQRKSMNSNNNQNQNQNQNHYNQNQNNMNNNQNNNMNTNLNNNANNMKTEEIRRQEFEKMQNFFREEGMKRDIGIQKQLDEIKKNVTNENVKPSNDTREKDIKNVLKKMENDTLNSEQSSKLSASSASSASLESEDKITTKSDESSKSKKSHKSIFSKSKNGNKRIISIKTNKNK